MSYPSGEVQKCEDPVVTESLANSLLISDSDITATIASGVTLVNGLWKTNAV